MHLRLNHPSLPTLVKLNDKVTGLPRKLVNRKQGMFPCHTCQDAKAERNDFPPSSENDAEGIWVWDMIDMGEDTPNIGQQSILFDVFDQIIEICNDFSARRQECSYE